MSYEALSELRNETYLMSPTVNKPSNQGMIRELPRSVKFTDDVEEKASVASAQDESQSFTKTANATF